MKNIHILATDKPSRLHLIEDTLTITSEYKNSFCDAEVNIYITSDEEIKEGDWILNETHNIEKAISHYNYKSLSSDCKKIILTTDQDLMKDGVQAIDDEFLEWFVKNPSCEEVEVKPLLSNNGRALFGYKIIIPKEKSKQETVQEVAERLYPIKIESCMEGKIDVNSYPRNLFIEGVKWQAKRSYSEEELRNAMNWMLTQYFEFHEWPATGRVDHYVQSIKSE